MQPSKGREEDRGGVRGGGGRDRGREKWREKNEKEWEREGESERVRSQSLKGRERLREEGCTTTVHKRLTTPAALKRVVSGKLFSYRNKTNIREQRVSDGPISLADEVLLVVAVLWTPFWGFQGTPNNCTVPCCFAIGRPTATGPVGESASTGFFDPPPRAFLHPVGVPNPQIMSRVQSEDELVLRNWAQCDKVTVQTMTISVGVGESHRDIRKEVTRSVKLSPPGAAVWAYKKSRRKLGRVSASPVDVCKRQRQWRGTLDQSFSTRGFRFSHPISIVSSKLSWKTSIKSCISDIFHQILPLAEGKLKGERCSFLTCAAKK